MFKAKTAMQSGTANTKRWVLEFEPSTPRATDPAMGWTGSPDPRGHVRMRFATRDEAVAFAERHGLSYRVAAPKERVIRPTSYATTSDMRALRRKMERSTTPRRGNDPALDRGARVCGFGTRPDDGRRSFTPTIQASMATDTSVAERQSSIT